MNQYEYFADSASKQLLFDFVKRNNLSDYDLYTIWKSKEFQELKDSAQSLLKNLTQDLPQHGDYVTEVIDKKIVINVFIDRSTSLNNVIDKRVKELDAKEEYHDKTIRVTKVK